MPASEVGPRVGHGAVRALRDPVIGGVAVGLALWTVGARLLPPDSSGLIATFWAVQALLDVVMLLTARQVASVAGDNVPLARFWRRISRACAFLVLADTVQTGAVLAFPGQDPITGGTPHAVLVIAGVVTSLVVTLTHPSELSTPQRRRMWLDATTVMAGVVAFLWYLDAGNTDVQTITMATFDVVFAFGLVRLALSARPPFTRGAAAVGVTGMTLTGIAGALSPVSATTLRPGALLLLLLPSATIAITPRVQALLLAVEPAERRRPRRPYSLLPYFAVVACQLLLIRVATTGGWTLQGWGVIGGNVVVTVLVVVRQLDAFRENASLVTRLDESLLALRRTEERFRSLVQRSSDITLIVTADDRISYASPAVETVLGISPDAAEGRLVRELMQLTIDDEVPGGGGPWRLAPSEHAIGRVPAEHADGSLRWLEVTVSDLRHDPGIDGVVWNARDVTEAHELQARLQHQASHDALTQLANRAAFDEQVRLASFSSDPAAVLMIDLNGFKPVNDTYGHHVGDGLLVQVARRLRECVRPQDTVARIGGDEFAVLLCGATHEQAVSVAARIASGLRGPVNVEGRQVPITASVGVAAGFADHLDILLREADAAMYRAKRGITSGGFQDAAALA
jgi:diguanylate cyclase (GGDEF)-like protein/PAS domain S-box-containing protein